MNQFFAELVNKGEDSFHEFKSSQVHPDSLAKEIVAFSNTMGGQIYLGIEDDGKITGVEKKIWEEKVIQISRNNIEPSIIPIIKIHNHNDLFVLEIDIEKGKNKPYKVKTTGKYYIRAGSVSIEPTREELVRLFQEGDMVHFEVKGIPDTSRKDLDHVLITDYCREYRKIDPDDDIDSLLVNLQLLGVNKESTILGMLFFGKDPIRYLPQTGIALHRFNGKDRADSILENREVNGPIPHLIDTAMKFISSNTAGKSELREGDIQRRDWFEYEEIIYRELLSNAFQHRDWSIFGQKIRVQMFSDRLEIFSPGKLPNTMALQNAIVGNSFYRNPLISQTLRDYGLVDKMGRGLFKVIRLCKEWNLPVPQFIETSSSFTAVVYKNKK